MRAPEPQVATTTWLRILIPYMVRINPSTMKMMPLYRLMYILATTRPSLRIVYRTALSLDLRSTIIPVKRRHLPHRIWVVLSIIPHWMPWITAAKLMVVLSIRLCLTNLRLLNMLYLHILGISQTPVSTTSHLPLYRTLPQVYSTPPDLLQPPTQLPWFLNHIPALSVAKASRGKEIWNVITNRMDRENISVPLQGAVKISIVRTSWPTTWRHIRQVSSESKVRNLSSKIHQQTDWVRKAFSQHRKMLCALLCWKTR